MKFIQLKYFLTVAQTGSITRAAEKLFITQSALSRVIQRLEDEIGVSLFNRGPGNITLNENGRLFQRSVTRMFDELDAGMRAVAASEKPGQPVIKLRSDVVDDIFTGTSDMFQTRFPDISFRFCERFGDDDSELSPGESADILLTNEYDANMTIAAEYSENWYTITAKASSTPGCEMSRDEFLSLPLAFHGPKNDLRFLKSCLDRAGMQINIITLDNNRQVASLINKGLARGCLPASVCSEYESSVGHGPPFYVKKVDGLTMERKIYLCHRHGFPESRREGEVLLFTLDYLAKFMKKLYAAEDELLAAQ